MPKNLDFEELLKEYQLTKDIELRNYLLLKKIYIAKNIATRIYLKYDLEFDEILNIAVIGLMQAFDKYNINNGKDFNYYAYKYTDGFVKNNFTDLLKIDNQHFYQLNKTSKYLYGEFDINNKEMLNDSIDYICKDNKTKKRNNLQNLVNINYPFNIEDLKDNIISNDLLENNIVKNSINDILYEAIKMLNEKDRLILSLVFGLYKNDSHTLKETSNILNISIQAVLWSLKKSFKFIKNYLIKYDINNEYCNIYDEYNDNTLNQNHVLLKNN